MTPEQIVIANYESWKENLLDMSKRNRLLYFKPDAAVQLVEPELEELWKRLIARGRPQAFYGLESENQFFAETESEEEIDEAPGNPLKSDEVKPNLSGQKLSRTLYNLRAKSNLSLEEQGFTTLYVAWGFLKWRDPKTGDDLTSPLILTPMTLLRESSRAAYKLKLYEEDLWLNPVLEWKLSTDYKIALPRLPNFEDADLFNYFDVVRSAIKPHHEWSVWEAAYLGLFSFQKMAMYQDLRDNVERACAHPFVRALGGDASLLPDIPSSLPKGSALDDIPTLEVFSVLDSDSSQNEAVQAAKAGVSFVLQGPPGTGKSQTITNIIAECLADGKRVLFVSEKMAALDVVHERLKRVGIEIFCLKAHSQSATKKEVIADLGRTLAAARTGAQVVAANNATRQDETEAAELERLRAGLNLFTRELHAPRSPLNISIYEAAGYIATHMAAPEIVAALPNPETQDTESLQRCRSTLIDALGDEEVWLQGERHAWFGAKVRDFSFDLIANIRTRALQSAQRSRDCAILSGTIASNLGLTSREYSLRSTSLILELATLVHELGRLHVPKQWLLAESLDRWIALAGEFEKRYESVAQRRRALDERYMAIFWGLPHAELLERVKVRYEATLSRAGTWEKFPEWHEELIRRLDDFAAKITSAYYAATAIARELSLQQPDSITGLASLLRGLMALQRELSDQTHPIRATWLNTEVQSKLKSLCEIAKNHAAARDEAAMHLENFDLGAMEHVELADWVKRFEVNYASPLRVLNGGFRADMRQLTVWKRDTQPISYEDAKAILREAVVWQSNKKILDSLAHTHSEAFGLAYKGDKTDWDNLAASLARCRTVTEAFAAAGGLSEECARALEQGAALQYLSAPLDTIVTAMRPLKEDLRWLAAIFSLENLPFHRDSLSLQPQHAPIAEFADWLQGHSMNLQDIKAAFDELMATQKRPHFLPAQFVCDCTEAIEILRLEDELAQVYDSLQTEFGHFFEGATTDWVKVHFALDWTNKANAWWKRYSADGHQVNERSDTTNAFISLVTTDEPRPDLCEKIKALQESVIALTENWNYFNDFFETPIGPRPTLQDDSDWYEQHAAQATEIEAYLRWRRQYRELDKLGLKEFWNKSLEAGLSSDSIPRAFERRFWMLWMDAALRDTQSLREFVGKRHIAATNRFIELDENSLLAAQRRLCGLLWEKKPVSTTGSQRGGEISILQREVVKKARHKPLRRLFHEIPHLLGALKPCMLMSPLSVAQFLEAERAAFDIVIFDEASQICPEDAVGSIMRSAQLIVVGDRRQLPPTRFFSSGGVFDEDTDEETDEGIFESILDMCAPHLPNFMLLWHYRSRDESLIAFSNLNFYDGRLITFPGPYTGGARGRGVRLEWVNGVYHRGQGRDARTNPIEALRVAELVIEHLEKAPGQSLGVIALNAQHARAIDEAVRRMLLDYPHLEPLLDERKYERFFIKALENVQGDERDVILLSIGFGPDSEGKVSMNFGPINKEGGERRLNVAVTRARDALTVVSSLQPENIDTSKTIRQGPKLLKSYLEMARRGGDYINPLADAEQELFVDAVDAALQNKGWRTYRGIGRSALKIDIAIEHPERPGEFVMGIECDGGDYRSASIARDRERLRPAVLRSLGWQLARIWCLDWMKHPDAEIERVQDTLYAVLQSPCDQRSIHGASEVYNSVPRYIHHNVLPSPPQSMRDCDHVAASSSTATAADYPVALISSIEPTQDRLGSALGDAGDVNIAPPIDSMELPAYRPLKIGPLGWPEEFRLLTPTSAALREPIWSIVQADGPVAMAEVVRRIAAAYGFSRAGAAIREIIVRAMQLDQRIEIRNQFAWPHGLERARLRIPANDLEARPVDEVCLEELQEAILFCLRAAYGMERAELVPQAARLLGWQRAGGQVAAKLDKAINSLLLQGQLHELDNALRIAE